MDPMRLLRVLAVCSALSLTLISARAEDLAAKSARAKDLMAAGRFEEAIPIYRELVKAIPRNPGPIMNLGLALHMNGQEREAIRQFQVVLRLEPNHLPAHLFLGAAYLGFKEPAQAIEPLKTVIHAKPNDKEARLMLGEAFLRSEEHTSELQSPCNLVCRLLLEKKKKDEVHLDACAYSSVKG